MVVAPPGRAADLRRVRRRGRPRGVRADRRRPRARRSRRDLVPEPRGVGARPVRDGEAGGDPRQRQPGLPNARARVRAASSRAAGCSSRRRSSRPATTSRWSARSATASPSSSASCSSTTRRGTSCSRARSASTWAPCASAPPGSTPPTRSTSSTRAARPASPRARRSRTTTSSTTATSSARAAGSRTRTGICVPVPYYHCFGMVMGNLAATTHGACVVLPGEAFEPQAVLEAVQDESCTVLYGVPTMFIAELDHPDFESLRPELAAHGDHGRLALPDRGHAQGHRPHAHGRGDHLLRHDRDVAGVHADRRRRRRSSTASGPSAASTRTSRSASPIPTTGRTLARGETGEFQTRGYSVMLGYWEEPERTAEAIDAARWMHTGDQAVMADDGYVQDRRPDQGHDHPRRRERLPARDRGVPLRPPGRRRRAGRRRARRALRRGDLAWVMLREGAAVDEEAMREFCRGKIAHYKVPRYVRPSTSFPMTVTGKVKKFKLREHGDRGARPRRTPRASRPPSSQPRFRSRITPARLRKSSCACRTRPTVSASSSVRRATQACSSASWTTRSRGCCSR